MLRTLNLVSLLKSQVFNKLNKTGAFWKLVLFCSYCWKHIKIAIINGYSDQLIIKTPIKKQHKIVQNNTYINNPQIIKSNNTKYAFVTYQGSNIWNTFLKISL